MPREETLMEQQTAAPVIAATLSSFAAHAHVEALMRAATDLNSSAVDARLFAVAPSRRRRTAQAALGLTQENA